jgi:cytochrome c-type biogenesis protein CcmH
MLVKNFTIKNILIITVSFFIMQFSLNNSLAVDPDEVLLNQNEENRARDISKKVRCVVCQNQSLDESNAPLAKDLRILIRNKIKDGNKDEEIYKFLTDRYGDFILLKPAFRLNTLALWFLPFIFLLIGVFIIYKHEKKSKKKLKM